MLALALKILWLAWSWIELVVFTLILYIWAWLPTHLTKPYFHKFFRIWCSLFVRALGVDLRLHQKNKFPLPKQYILIANHPSAFEDVGIPALFDVYPLAKEGVKSWWIAGRINIAAGTIFVKRKDRASRRDAVELMMEKLQQGQNIALFPEGGCFGRRIHEVFQAGAFDLSIRTGIPIIPVFINYEAQDVFEWTAPHTLIDKMWHFMSSPNDHANFIVFDAISPEGQTDKFKFAEEVRQQYLVWQAKYLD